MHTHRSSDHLINDTDNRSSDLSDGTKAFTRNKSFTYILWPVE